MRNKTPWKRSCRIGVCTAILLAAMAVVNCGRDPSLVIENTKPPRFVFSGSGTVTHLTITGPDLERDPKPTSGGDHLTPLKVYWEIASTPGTRMNDVGPVTYGQVPPGFVQIEPQNGASPPNLIEQHSYNFRLSVDGGDGFNRFFVIRDGRIVTEADQ
jgi:hypothetical protein